MKTAVNHMREFIDFLKNNHVSDMVEKSRIIAGRSNSTSGYANLPDERIRAIASDCLEDFFHNSENTNSNFQQNKFTANKSQQLAEEFCKIWIEKEQKKLIIEYTIKFGIHSDGLPQIIAEIENYYDSQLSASLLRIQQASRTIELRAEGQAKKLEMTEKDAQHFTYAASHDLQEPLRMITSYLQLLSNKYKGELNAEANEFIELALDGSTRMKSLISNLLEFSRLNKQPDLKKMNTNTTLASVLEKMSFQIKESNAKITVDNLPEIVADSDLITKLFQHILLNAIKFKKGEPLKIDIHVEEKDSAYQFSIADNGIGIQKDYFDKIFIIFQRLHSKNKYPGTGIGLALCKKIVELHGGRIWVESEIDNGATFYFTIPMTTVLTETLANE